MSKFSRNDSPNDSGVGVRKIQTFNSIYHFKARDREIFNMYNYFREIIKFRDFMNTLRNYAKFVLLVFLRNLNKKFILTESPDHVL